VKDATYTSPVAILNSLVCQCENSPRFRNIIDIDKFSLPAVTGPVARFARQIAGHGYIVAAPSSYHEFTGPEALAYDGPGTDKGNAWKIEKKVSAYDEDSTLSIDHLVSLATCNGRIGATGMLALPTLAAPSQC